MNNKELTAKAILAHYKKYPLLQIRDLFKFLYQSSFGCEHSVSSYENVCKRIKEEYNELKSQNKCGITFLDGEYCRIDLSYLNKGLSAETLGKLFLLSAKTEKNATKVLTEKLKVATVLVNQNLLPYQETAFKEEVKKWQNNGFCAISHSDVFKKAYTPSYRVISKQYIQFLDLFANIDKRLCNTSLKVAIEGASASGKTFLSKILEEVYDCTVFHMDDFFLQPQQRTEERFSEVGGNIDHERFLQEVLLPLNDNKEVELRRFSCNTMSLEAPKKILPKKLIITEGAYSMHPNLCKFYDFSVFLDVPPTLQKNRILKRNSPDLAKRFFEEWIPLENRYFEKTNAKERCDMCIQIK